MKLLILLAMPFLTACPNPETGKIDPYMTARTVINQSQTVIAIADSIMYQWKLGQTDALLIKKADQSYQKIKAGVVGGLQLALDGVDIAQQAAEDPNVPALMSQANNAWQTLRSTLTQILTVGKKVDYVLVAPTEPIPAPISKEKVESELGQKTVALKTVAKKSPVDHLPVNLPGS